MKLLHALPLILLAVVSLSVLTAECSDAAATDLLIYEVNPYYDDEGVSLHNFGSTNIDLKGYTVTDNPSKTSSEGTLTFSQSLIIHPGETLTFVKKTSSDSTFADRHTTYINGTSGVTFSSKFALNDSGDDLYLFKGDAVIDAMCYNNTTISDTTLWVGEPFKVTKPKFIIRVDDGRDASCWRATKAGYTDLFFDPELEMEATITPFMFPDCGGIPIYRALENAKSSVCIAIYTLQSENVYALLCDLEKRGVEVTLVLEYSPLGDYKPTDSASVLKALYDAGGDIFFIGTMNSDRFNLQHAKYCIIDGETVILSSENWTANDMNGKIGSKGNRGWGAVIESVEYASYMMDVFENDKDPRYGDVKSFPEVITKATAKSLTYKEPQQMDLKSYRATVTPAISPDSSFDAIQYYISNASSRIYGENQSLQDDYLDQSVVSPVSLISEKSKAGVDSKLLFGTNVATAQINKLIHTFGIESAVMETPYLHNKGLVCDNDTILSSVNWTDNSFTNNREIMAIIHSKEISDLFSESFLEDFYSWYADTELTVVFTEISKTYTAGSPVTISVDVKQKGEYTYSWDMDGSVKETTSPRTSFNLDQGDHTLKVTVTKSGSDARGYAVAEFSVASGGSGGASGILDDLWTYAAPLFVIFLAVAVVVLRRR